MSLFPVALIPRERGLHGKESGGGHTIEYSVDKLVVFHIKVPIDWEQLL